MIDDPYYAHHSPYVLKRHVVVCSIPGGKCGAVAQSITALTGLRLLDVDRTLEHQLGDTLHRACLKAGMEEVKRRKTTLLESTLKQSPRGIISLGDVALLTPQLIQTLVHQTTSVFLEWHPLEIRRNLPEELGRHPERYSTITPDSEINFSTVQAWTTQTASLFHHPTHRVRAAGREPFEIAREIMTLILD